MVSAYILAKMEAGREEEIFSKIRQLKEIKKAVVTYGIYDLLVNVDFERVEDLDDFVFNVIRRIPGVKETVTMIVVKSLV